MLVAYLRVHSRAHPKGGMNSFDAPGSPLPPERSLSTGLLLSLSSAPLPPTLRLGAPVILVLRTGEVLPVLPLQLPREKPVLFVRKLSGEKSAGKGCTRLDHRLIHLSRRQRINILHQV